MKSDMTHNRLVRFLLAYSDADLGISAIILLATTIGMTVAFIVFAAEQTRLLQLEFINVGFHNPKFFEDVRGIAGLDTALSYSRPTSNYVTYELMRQNIFPIGAIMVLVYVLINAWGEASGILSGGTTKPMFLKFLGMTVLVLIFVPVWDIAAVEVEKFSVSMLNPMYDMHADDLCVSNPDKVLLLVASQNQEIYQRLETATLGLNDKGACHPQLRIAYVYQKAFSGATNTLDDDIIGYERILANFSNLGEIIGSTIFLGMTKTMLLFSLTLMGLIVMTIRELFLALLISLLPMFLLLAFVPKTGAIFTKMLETIIPLMLIPIITAAVFLTGAGILLDMEDGFAEGRADGTERFTFWIASVSLLILATGIPLLMAPVLSGVAGQASAMVSTAVISGVMGAMNVIKGGTAGTVAGIKGVQDSKSGFASKAGLAGIFGGMSHGIGMGAASAVMSDASIGMSQMVPGAGSVGSPFAKQSGQMLGYAGSGSAGGYDPQMAATQRGNASQAASQRRSVKPVILPAPKFTHGVGHGPAVPASSSFSSVTGQPYSGAGRDDSEYALSSRRSIDDSGSSAGGAPEDIPENDSQSTGRGYEPFAYLGEQSSDVNRSAAAAASSSSPSAPTPIQGVTGDPFDTDVDMLSRRNHIPTIPDNKGGDTSHIFRQIDLTQDGPKNINTEFNRVRKN